jgi:ADP-dependent phosphofructokinase/glucokinase
MTSSALAVWRDTYAASAERLLRLAPSAAPALTGASACVDAIFQVDVARAAALAGAARGTGTRTEDVRGRELLAEVFRRLAAARGGELLHRWAGAPAWLGALLGEPDRTQLGGTGPQASWALAVLGAPSVLALDDRSAVQLAVLDPRTGVVSDGTVVPAGTIAPSGTLRKLPHFVLEFAAGTPIGADAMVSRSTRIILRFGDEPLERDEQFAALTPTLPGVRAGLVSGLNGLTDDDPDSVAWLTRLARSWAEAGLPVIHHELAEYPSVARLHAALDTRMAGSVGLSLSELTAFTGRRGDPRLLARDLAERARACRVVVHADEWALAVHRGDPRHEADVLVAGSTLAAARARAGVPTRDLTPPASAAYTGDLPADGPLGDGWVATSVPSPYLCRPVATVGLGDTFVAGLLLAESLP